ncbi:MAG: hypothetical protein GXP23_05570 [Gammaproteobacteria bacterium]|nr:hypothetical protein [Gammaproteobacteria bacterium]
MKSASTTNNKRSPVCVVCSSGGHLSEALAAIEKINVPHYFVIFYEPHVVSRLRDEEVHYVIDPHKSPIGVKNLWQSSILFFRKRPKVIISTGAGIALSTCILGKIFGSRIIFIETGARVTSPSRTGLIMYRVADLFIVQWKPMLKVYPKAIYGGPLL